jgi:hypothetical protein
MTELDRGPFTPGKYPGYRIDRNPRQATRPGRVVRVGMVPAEAVVELLGFS